MADHHHRDEAKAPRPPRQGRTPKREGKPAAGGDPKSAAPGRPAQGERVAKALARAGVASRREVERLIGLGKVAVNGRILDTPATLVQPEDVLTVDGRVVNGPEPARLWRYHKPAGLVTTHRDPQNRPTVFQSLPEQLPRVISVGRLDLNSEGLLLLTNDGALSRALELPSNGWVRRYRARAFGRVTQAKLDSLKQGISVEGVDYGPIEAKLDQVQVKPGQEASAPANVWISLSLNEGKNREVRKVLEALGLKVNRLIRLAYGPFELGALPAGSVEEVSPRAVRQELAQFIAPENLPTGDRAATGPMRSPKLPTLMQRARAAGAAAVEEPQPERPRRSETERPAHSSDPKSADGRPKRWAADGGKSRRPDQPRGEARSDRRAPDRRFTEGEKRPDGRSPDRRSEEGKARPPKPSAKAGWAKPKSGKPGARPFGPKGPRKPGGPGEHGPRSGPPRSGPPRTSPPRGGRPPRSGGSR